MFGFNSWSDFTNKATESLQTASSSAKSGLQNVSDKTKEFAGTFPDNAKTKLSKLQENVSSFVEDQRLQYKQVEHETELKKRRKERKAKLLKYGIPPWHVFEETNDLSTSFNDENGAKTETQTESQNINNNERKENENINSSSQKNCTYEELRLLVLKLCEDENTFLVEAPSSSTVFPFHMETALPYANASLNYDPILPRIRYKLVPKRVSETQFWKNYFYRVQLIRESMGYPKIDLSVKAPTMEQLKQQISNGNNNNDKSNSNIETNQSIFEQTNDSNNNVSSTNDNPNDPNKSNGLSLKVSASPRSHIDTKNNKNSLNVSGNGNNNSDGIDTSDCEINNSLFNSVVSLDSSKTSIGVSETTMGKTNDNSIVNVTTKTDSSNQLQSISTNTIEENDSMNDVDVDDDDEDDDFMASNDLHIDALSPAARARMTQELGLNKTDHNDNNQSVQEMIDDIDDIDDTDDVEALLANVDVDGASDMSDAELAKVMSEVENE